MFQLLMSTIELKQNLHQLIDSTDNEAILTKYYSFMTTVSETKDGMLWNRLTKAEQEELLLSDLEADDPNNLISHKEVLHQQSRWL